MIDVLTAVDFVRIVAASVHKVADLPSTDASAIVAHKGNARIALRIAVQLVEAHWQA